VHEACCTLYNYQYNSGVVRRVGAYLVAGENESICKYDVLGASSSKHNNLCYVIGSQGVDTTITVSIPSIEQNEEAYA
jgi:hypothetical protein